MVRLTCALGVMVNPVAKSSVPCPSDAISINARIASISIGTPAGSAGYE